MQSAIRPTLVTGIGAAAVAALAINPVSVPLPEAGQISIGAQTAAVRLTAAADPFQEFVKAFNTASANATKIAGSYFKAPEAFLQQVLVNQTKYLGQVMQNPNLGTLQTVLEQIRTNIQAAIDVSTVVNAPSAQATNGLRAGIDTLHQLGLNNLPGYLNLPADQVDQIKKVMTFLASPATGVLIGLAGPVISPAVALGQSIQAIVGHLSGTPDLGAAVQEFINIPGNMIGAFFNGATANLDALVPVINNSGILKSGTSLNSLSMAFGGLFSTGSTRTADGIGGSIFNSMGMNVSTSFIGVPITLNIPGQAVGPLAAMTSLSQLIARAIGWNGTGNPLANIAFPTLPTPAPAPATLTTSPAAAEQSITSIPEVRSLTAAPKPAAAVSPAVSKVSTTTPTAKEAPEVDSSAPQKDSAATAAGATDSTAVASGAEGPTKADDAKTKADTKADTKKAEAKTKAEAKKAEAKTKAEAKKAKAEAKKAEAKSEADAKKAKADAKKTESKTKAEATTGASHAGTDAA